MTQKIKSLDRTKYIQYTKKIVSILTIMACVWITLSYVLAGISLFMYGSTEPLSELSQQVCITVLGVVISYCIKSFCETYSEKKNEVITQQQEIIKKNENPDSCG